MTHPSELLVPFQLEAARKGLKHTGFLLLAPMGSGKTWMTLEIVRRRHRRQQVSRVLLVCQLTLKEQWKENILQWFPQAIVTDNERDDGELVFVVSHYEHARNQHNPYRRARFDMMIADECHKLKSYTSKQSRRLWMISRTIPYKIGLTGTPVEGNELDFWAQVRFVNERIFGDSWTNFKDEWTRPAGFMGKKPKLLNHRRTEFLERIGKISFTVTDKEALQLPEALHVNVPVTLAPKHRRIYSQMENDLVVTLPGLDVAAPLVVTQLLRLQQIVGGFLPDEAGNPYPLGSIKQIVCTDLVENHPDPIVIYCRFLSEIDALEKRIAATGRKVGIITGDRVTGNPAAFDVLICQIGIVAGLDGMQHVASDAIFFSKSFSSIQYRQAMSRLRRRGQETRVKFFHLVADATIDSDLENALREKTDVTESVVTALLKRRLSDGESRKEHKRQSGEAG